MGKKKDLKWNVATAVKLEVKEERKKEMKISNEAKTSSGTSCHCLIH